MFLFVPVKYSSLSFDLFSFDMFQSSILIWISLISLSLILNITPLFYSWRFLDSGRSSRNDANSICTCKFEIAPFATSLQIQMSRPWIFKPASAVGQWGQSSHYFSQPRLSVPPLCTGRPPGLPVQNSQMIWINVNSEAKMLETCKRYKCILQNNGRTEGILWQNVKRTCKTSSALCSSWLLSRLAGWQIWSNLIQELLIKSEETLGSNVTPGSRKLTVLIFSSVHKVLTLSFTKRNMIMIQIPEADFKHPHFSMLSTSSPNHCCTLAWNYVNRITWTDMTADRYDTLATEISYSLCILTPWNQNNAKKIVEFMCLIKTGSEKVEARGVICLVSWYRPTWCSMV